MLLGGGCSKCMKVAAKFKADASKRWLTLDYRPLELEKQVREFWEKTNVREKLEQQRLEKNRGVLGFVEGPPTLNGVPHVGHHLKRAWDSNTGEEYNTFRKMQNVTDMKFDDSEDEGCSRK